jgi:hypothetical protein
MPYQMPCPDCKKMNAPYMDQKTEKVYCSLCNFQVEPVSHFTKIQMKALKQYREVNKASFSVKCVSCNREERPVLINGEVACGSCKKQHSHLTDFFKQMLKTRLQKADSDV